MPLVTNTGKIAIPPAVPSLTRAPMSSSSLNGSSKKGSASSSVVGVASVVPDEEPKKYVVCPPFYIVSLCVDPNCIVIVPILFQTVLTSKLAQHAHIHAHRRAPVSLHSTKLWPLFFRLVKSPKTYPSLYKESKEESEFHQVFGGNDVKSLFRDWWCVFVLWKRVESIDCHGWTR